MFASARPHRLARLLAATLVVAGGLAAAGARADDGTTGDLTIGTEADYAPFESVGPDGKPVGFDIDIGDAVCAAARLRCHWVNMDFDGLLPALDSHRIGAAMSEISVTPAREKKALFTSRVTRVAGVMISPSGSGISSAALATLDGKTVGVQSGTVYEVFAKEKLKNVTVQVYQSQLQAFQDLTAGRIDATLCDQGIGYTWLKQHAGAFVFSGPPLRDPEIFGIGTAIALRLGDAALKQKLDKALSTIMSNGTYARINKKYFPFSLMPNNA